jgi:N-acetylglutamate synthase-like GNAT family acetyltransferase
VKADAITIRPARDDDADALCALIATIFAEYPGVFFVIEEMPELRHIATAFAEGAFWCAERQGEVVGCVGSSPTHMEDGVELKKLYVATSQRREGLGGRLADRVEQAARDRGARFVELWSDVKFETAHRFYEARGYERGTQTRELHDVSDTLEFYFRKVL